MSDVDFESFGTITKPVADYSRWGTAVSLSADGKRMAVSALKGGPDRNGVVAVYEYSESGGWTQLGSDIVGDAYDWSGRSVALSGNGEVVVLCAEYSSDGGQFAGQTRAFQYDSSTSSWVQKGQEINGENAYDSGWSVATNQDGDRLVMGAAFNDGAASSAVSAGHARAYKYNSSTLSWEQMGADIDGDSALDYSGFAVDMSADGRRIVVGALGNDDGGDWAGQVRVFEWTGEAWVQVGLDIDGSAEGEWFGGSVAISGDGSWVIAGGPRSGGAKGAARVLKWESGGWAQVGPDILGQNSADLLGKSQGGSAVAIDYSGDYIVVGAAGANGGGIERGEVRVFYWNAEGSGEWVQVGDTYTGTGDYGGFGGSVAIASNALVIAMGEAAVGYDDKDGQVHTFGVNEVVYSHFWGSIPML